MKIAVLGAGNVGGVLGTRWGKRGHEVIFGSRNPTSERVRELQQAAGKHARACTMQDAAAEADVLLLATTWRAAPAVLQSLGDLSGKILIDCINALDDDLKELEVEHASSAGERIAEWAPGALVVKAFNMVGTRAMEEPLYGDQPATLFYCGDSPAAKAVVRGLAEDLGFEAVDAGPLAMSRDLEHLALFYIHLALRQGWGADCAFKMLHR